MNDPTNTYLSRKAIPASDRLIVALDVSSYDQALTLIDQLGESVTFFKVGLELFVSGDFHRLVETLAHRNKHIFADLKMFDVPVTVSRAMQRLATSGAEFVTVHGNDAILEAACAAKGPLKVLAVTVLTSLDEGDMRSLGFQASIEDVVAARAMRALEIGCDGVISSGLEAPKLREKLGERFLVVTPGIRPGANKPVDDQKRTVDVEEAFLNGADYIVIGREIHGSPDPHAAATAIQSRIAALFNT